MAYKLEGRVYGDRGVVVYNTRASALYDHAKVTIDKPESFISHNSLVSVF